MRGAGFGETPGAVFALFRRAADIAIGEVVGVGVELPGAVAFEVVGKAVEKGGRIGRQFGGFLHFRHFGGGFARLAALRQGERELQAYGGVARVLRKDAAQLFFGAGILPVFAQQEGFGVVFQHRVAPFFVQAAVERQQEADVFNLLPRHGGVEGVLQQIGLRDQLVFAHGNRAVVSFMFGRGRPGFVLHLADLAAVGVGVVVVRDGQGIGGRSESGGGAEDQDGMAHGGKEAVPTCAGMAFLKKKGKTRLAGMADGLTLGKADGLTVFSRRRSRLCQDSFHYSRHNQFVL